MSLEQHVTSLELSKQLKESGYLQEGLFWWVLNGSGNNGWSLMYETEVFNLKNEAFERIAAPLASEIILPRWIKEKKGDFHYSYSLMEFWPRNYSMDKQVMIRYIEGDWDHGFEEDSNDLWGEEDENEANARAKMYLYLYSHHLLEEGKTT